jgi:hypothetical protein
MKKDLLNSLQLICMLLLIQLVACTSTPNKKDQPPPPAPPTCFLPILGHIYGKPTEIRESIISDPKPKEDVTTLDWASRKVSYSSSILKESIYLGADFRPDSSLSEDHKALQHYLKTPYYKYYYTFSRTKEPAEYHFHYELDTAKRQVREVKANPADTSDYSIDFFSRDGFLIHRFVKITNKEHYHLYYTNDNHGNPIEERIVIMNLDFIQQKCEYEYDKEGNWLAKDLYHYSPDGKKIKMQFRRKITY